MRLRLLSIITSRPPFQQHHAPPPPHTHHQHTRTTTTTLNRQVEGAFSQPNSGVAAQMLAWAQDVTRGSEGHDLLGEGGAARCM